MNKDESSHQEFNANTLNVSSLIWRVLLGKFKAFFHLGSR